MALVVGPNPIFAKVRNAVNQGLNFLQRAFKHHDRTSANERNLSELTLSAADGNEVWTWRHNGQQYYGLHLGGNEWVGGYIANAADAFQEGTFVVTHWGPFSTARHGLVHHRLNPLGGSSRDPPDADGSNGAGGGSSSTRRGSLRLPSPMRPPRTPPRWGSGQSGGNSCGAKTVEGAIGGATFGGLAGALGGAVAGGAIAGETSLVASAWLLAFGPVGWAAKLGVDTAAVTTGAVTGAVAGAVGLGAAGGGAAAGIGALMDNCQG